ncbi:FAD-dependent oxidoreductase, partial [Nostoc sp. NIES-2111]
MAIVCAGFAGLSAARRLRQITPDARIVIVDAGRVAEGGAGRNSGFMIDLPHDLTSHDYAGGSEDRDRLLTRLNRYAIDWAGEAVRDYAIPEGYFRRVGKINGAA